MERDERTHAVLGAAFEVHGLLGPGFLEAVYCQALALEFDERHIPYRREAPFSIEYKGHMLDASYRVDFLCFDSVVVEIKAIPSVGALEKAQVINYLKASGLEVGLLLNFGARSLQYERIARSKSA